MDVGSGPFDVAGLAMRSDGLLLGVTYQSDELWLLDPTGGLAALIGPTGIDVNVRAGLALDACGNLWMTSRDRLYSVDPLTGTATEQFMLDEDVKALTAEGTQLLGLIDVGGQAQLVSIDPSNGSQAYFGDLIPLPSTQRGLDFDLSGRLWGLFWNDGPIVTWGSSVVEFDPTSGAALSTLQLPAAQIAVALGGNLAVSPPHGVCSSVQDIPMTPPAAATLGVLLAAFGAFILRREG